MDYTTQTIQHGSCTITIQRPILTPAEQTKRGQAVKGTLERVLRDYVRRKEKKQ